MLNIFKLFLFGICISSTNLLSDHILCVKIFSHPIAVSGSVEKIFNSMQSSLSSLVLLDPFQKVLAHV